MRKTLEAPDITGLADRVEKETASGRRIEYRCTLVTPMYGGGVKAGQVDRAMPIRATAIRGQLRHWWRFLNRFDSDGNPLSAKTLFERERAIWGGLGDADASSKHGALAKSKVTIRISLNRPIGDADIFAVRSVDQREKKAVWDKRVERAQYALFPAQGKHEKGADAFSDPPDSLLDAGLEFRLLLVQSQELDDSDWCTVLKAVQWWGHFGGIGARTRRGLGALLVKDADGQVLPIPSDRELKAAGCRLGFLRKQVNRNPAGRESQDATQSWFRAVEELKYFRQTIDRQTTTARWPESKFIRSVSGYLKKADNDESVPSAFPRAVFGLPIITHFKDSEKYPEKHPQDTELLPIPEKDEAAAHRMASPLILRPVYDGGEWRPAGLLLPNDHVQTMGLQLAYTHKKTGKDVLKMSADKWWRAEYVKDTPALRADEFDPLISFMRRFLEFPSKRPDYEPEKILAALPKRIALVRPNLTRNHRNGSITIDSNMIKKKIVLIGKDADECFSKLTAYAQQRLRTSKPFNRLTITIDGDRFVELQEHAE